MSQETFAGLGLPGELVEVLDRRLITEPFEIQAKAVPDALIGRDILGRAPTGSGKTLAFGLPMLARLASGTRKRPRGLVLSPTRELAEQICRELEPLAAAMDRNVLAVYGGTGLGRQITALRRGVDLMVACPGRLLDLIEQQAVQLDDVDIVVVDEADRMADMGFLPDVRRLLDQTTDDRQTMLFSATLDRDVQILIDRYQHDPVVVEVGEVEPDLSLVDHRFIKVPKPDRVWLAADLIADAGPTVVFARTRHGVDRLARQLKHEGIKAGYIHGGRSQSQRDRALQVFVDGKVDALVATDVAARGIHVDGVACVIHYDPPAEIKDYVHRSGRTARAGANGTVVSFLDPPQVKESQKMQRQLGLEADIEPVPERKPRSSRPAAVDDRRNGAAGRSGNGRSSNKQRKQRSGSRASATETHGSPSTGRSRNGKRSGAGAGSGADGRSPRSRIGKQAGAEERSPSTGRSRNGKRSGAGAGSGADGRSPRSRIGKQAGAEERSPSTGRSRNGKQAGAEERSPSTGRSRNGKPAGARRRTAADGGAQAGARQGAAKGETPPSSNRSSAGSEPRARRGAEPSATSGRPGSAKRSAKAGAGRTGPARATSKRSGKPRPKNRKNKPRGRSRG